MALLIDCLMCGKEFLTSAKGSSICNNCNGNNEARVKEEERWANLTSEQKIEELRARVESLEKHECNPLIG